MSTGTAKIWKHCKPPNMPYGFCPTASKHCFYAQQGISGIFLNYMNYSTLPTAFSYLVPTETCILGLRNIIILKMQKKQVSAHKNIKLCLIYKMPTGLL